MTVFRPAPLATIAPAPSQNKQARGAAIAGGVGTMIEGYDFSMYGYMAVFVAPLFFPNADPIVSLLSTLLVFAASYLIRPLGGVVFGHIGDRISRKTALLMTLLLMGCSSTLIGILPSHAQIGVWAPLLLVLLRLLQGFSVGGEVAGAATMVNEVAGKNSRGRFGALNPMGATLGFALASATAGVVANLTSNEQMAEWGWRIPFILALPLTIVSFLLRRKLVAAHSPQASSETTKIPVLDVIARSPRTLIKAVVFSMAVNGTAYFGLTFMSIHMLNRLGRDAGETYIITTIVVIAAALLMPLAGFLGDKISLPNLALVGLSGYALLSVPGMMLINTAGGAATLIGFLLIMVNTAALQVSGYTLMPQLFERKVRYTGAALGWNFGAVISGGTAPALCVWLVEATGNITAPAYYVVGLAIVGALAVLAIKRSPLPQD